MLCNTTSAKLLIFAMCKIDQKTDAIELLVTLLQAFRYCGTFTL